MKKTAGKKAKGSICDEPGLVAHLVPYPPFIFPGEAGKPPAAESPAILSDEIRRKAEFIEENRFEGSSEAFAGFLVDKLLDWLAGRAGDGSAHAQASLVDASRKAVGWHSWSLLNHHEITVNRARICPEIPGWISLNPEQTAYWQTQLEEIGQGSKTPVPMKRDPKAKRSRRDITRGNHRLVSALHDYMMRVRGNLSLNLLEIPKDHPEIPPRVRDILELPDFSTAPDSITAWHKVGFEIVKDSTGKSPETHPVFNRPPLDEMNRAHTRSSISTDLKTAWKALASEKSRIESGE